MNPMIIALICAAAFGTVMVISAFIRQLLLSRDKKLNDEAQKRALTQEVSELEKMRAQMQSQKRLDTYYQVLDDNKQSIKDLDKSIEDFFAKKMQLVEDYARIIEEESAMIISSGELSEERHTAIKKIKDEIDSKLSFYDRELHFLQRRRDNLYDTHNEVNHSLLAQEKLRNANMDSVYKQHTALLEKVFLRHIGDTELVAVETIRAGTISFKDMMLAPVQLLMQFFGRGLIPQISVTQTRVEHQARMQIDNLQRDINELPNSPNLKEQEQTERDEEVTSSISFAS